MDSTSTNIKKNLNSWTELKGSVFCGDAYFMESIIYSPQNISGLTISVIGRERRGYHYLNFEFRVIEMATGNMKHYIVPSEYEWDTVLLTYYYLTENEFVLVTYDPSQYMYNQQLFGIDIEKNRIMAIGYTRSTPVYAPSDKSDKESFMANGTEGCHPLVINGKKYHILPAADGLVLLPWNPLNLTPWSYPQNTGVYIKFTSVLWHLNGYDIFEYAYFTFGSKLYFQVSKQNIPEHFRDNFDKFAVLDLNGIDLQKKEIVLSSEFANFSMVHFEHQTIGTYTGTQLYRYSQRGKYIIATEMRNFTDLAHTRPAVRSRVYILDLESIKTTLVWVRLREGCHVTLFNSSLLIWRNRLKWQSDIELDIEEDEEMQLPRVIIEYKTARITGFPVPCLFSLSKNSLLFGRCGVTLPNIYIDRFFNKIE